MAKFAGELVGIAPWKKKLLALFLLVAAVGAVLRVPAWINPPAADTPAEQRTEAPDGTVTAPPGAQGFVDSGERRTSSDPAGSSTADSDAAPAELPWTARLGGWMAKLGLSFAGGLVLGVFFRSFLKTMAAITALLVVGLVGLSYFEVVNVDFTTMRQNYDSFAEWISDQGYRFKDMIVAFLPSATSAAVGFFIGFIRR
jgi:uncharacterized membrane protein (Fun14 family)